MIHISIVRKILKEGKPFSCRVWKKNGDILIYNNVVCTSTNFRKNSANLKFIESGEIRKVRIITIWEINDTEIHI